MSRMIMEDSMFSPEHTKTKKVVAHSFLGGIFWGVGSVIGATLVISVLAVLLHYFGYLPIVGDFFRNIESEIGKRKSTTYSVDPVNNSK